MERVSLIDRTMNAMVRRIKRPVYYTVFRLTGVRLQLETHYNDLSMMGAVFTISSDAAKGILPSERLIPVERAAGITDIHFVALEYRSIDILFPYNEFAVFIPAVYKLDNEAVELQGYYYLYLPVTTEDARWGGVENLGLPKFVADITFTDMKESRSCTLRADGKDILTLTVNKLPTELRSWEFSNFGVRDDWLLRNTFQMHGQGGTGTAAGGAAFTLGDHPIADRLKALEIGKVSVQQDYVPQATAVLSRAIGLPLPLS
jgi:hypothetical protein